jgi:hypothetical protein
MSRYDSVDRLMDMATEKAVPARGVVEESVKPDAHAVLEAQVTRVEAGIPAVKNFSNTAAGGLPGKIDSDATAKTGTQPLTPPEESLAKTPAPGKALPGMSRADRGRQLLGALRPFLPVVGSALRMVDHGAVQAVARLLPLLGGPALGGGQGIGSGAGAAQAAEAQDQLAQILTTLDARQTKAGEDAKVQKLRIDTLDEQVRRTREILERLAAEQNTENHELQRLSDRMRLLTAGVVILLMLVVAEMALFVVVLHK